MKMLTGNGYPSKRMPGELGQYYKNLDTGDIFELVSAYEVSRVNGNVAGGYIWKKIARGDHLEACNADLDEAPSEVVILPETVFEIASQGQPAYIREPLSATPTNGATAKVSYNGTEYMCRIAHVEDDGTTAFVIGNFDAMGTPVPGGNPTAPFVAVLYEAEENGAYGMIVSLEDVSTVTLSIVQVGAASGGGSESAGGGVYIVNGTVAFSEDMTGISGTFDKTIAEVMEAHHAGKIVQLRADLQNYGSGVMLLTASMETSDMIIWQGLIETMIVGIHPSADYILQGSIIQLAMLGT